MLKIDLCLNSSMGLKDILYLQDLVGRLTLDEMVAQMSHGGANENGTHYCNSRTSENRTLFSL